MSEPRHDRPFVPARPGTAEETALLDPDLSLLEFNLRVLALAEDRRTPVLERLGFLAIVSANLDEFFMVNVGALKLDARHGRLQAVAIRLRPLLERFQRDIFPLLTPRAITMSPGFPVPLLPHLTLCPAVSLTDEDAGPTTSPTCASPNGCRASCPPETTAA